MYYFAYGSNMLKSRIEDRLKSVTDLGIAVLKSHKIKFNKQSKDGSGKTNIVSDIHSNVLGVIYNLTEEQITLLDRNEIGYERIKIIVEFNSISTNVETYIAKPNTINENLLPTSEYLGYLITGAREHSFSQTYIESLELIKCQK
jgi:hypothetical protein